MIETIGKNLWILLTVILPGLFTYGTWRLLLILHPSQALAEEVFSSIDESGIITLSMIISIALLQQAVGITIEFILSLIAKKTKHLWNDFYSLFWERFELASAGKLNESSTRIVGNFFLSINIFVGLTLLFTYFSYYELLPVTHWIPKILIFFLLANLATIIFRMFNAISVIKRCKNE